MTAYHITDDKILLDSIIQYFFLSLGAFAGMILAQYNIYVYIHICTYMHTHIISQTRSIVIYYFTEKNPKLSTVQSFDFWDNISDMKALSADDFESALWLRVHCRLQYDCFKPAGRWLCIILPSHLSFSRSFKSQFKLPEWRELLV